jgi:hypothetical protein
MLPEKLIIVINVFLFVFEDLSFKYDFKFSLLCKAELSCGFGGVL